MQLMQDSEINSWPTPAESTDLNAIEMLWHKVKSFLRRIIKPKVKDNFVNGINEFWHTVTAGKCQHYINHLQKVLPTIVKRRGRASGH